MEINASILTYLESLSSPTPISEILTLQVISRLIVSEGTALKALFESPLVQKETQLLQQMLFRAAIAGNIPFVQNFLSTNTLKFSSSYYENLLISFWKLCNNDNAKHAFTKLLVTKAVVDIHNPDFILLACCIFSQEMMQFIVNMPNFKPSQPIIQKCLNALHDTRYFPFYSNLKLVIRAPLQPKPLLDYAERLHASLNERSL